MKNELKKPLKTGLEFEYLAFNLKLAIAVWINRSGKLTIQHKYKQVSYDDIDEV